MANLDSKLPEAQVKIIIRQFNVDEHLKFINEWLIARNMHEITSEDIPQLGYILFHENLPVVTAFLRVCEGDMGFLEGLTTNPEAHSLIRNIGIDAITNQIVKKSKDLGMKRIIAWSLDSGTLLRSEKHGFLRSPFTLIVRDSRFDATLYQ
jgi:hypothetical protein